MRQEGKQAVPAFLPDGGTFQRKMGKRTIEEPMAHQIVSNAFRQTVFDNELTGFIFKQVWNSEE